MLPAMVVFPLTYKLPMVALAVTVSPLVVVLPVTPKVVKDPSEVIVG